MVHRLRRYSLIFALALLIAVFASFGVVSGQAQAALVFHSGFETSDFSEWSGVTGSPAVVEANGWGSPKTGTYAMRVNASTTYAALLTAFHRRATFYLLITTAPDDADVIILGRTGAAQQGNIKLTTARKLNLYGGTTLRITGTTVLDVDTWYRISASLDDAGNGKLFINGSEEGSTAALEENERQFQRALGVAGGLPTTVDLHFDDFACDDTASTADLGDIRVAAASPNDTGTYAQYDTSSGFGNVDEIPANDADFIEDNQGDPKRESYNIPNLGDLAGASSGDTVNAVSVWIRGDRDGGGATDHKAMVRDNGSDYESDALPFNGIAWFNWYLAVMPDDSAAWLEARFNSLEIGAYHSGAQDQRVHCLVAMVAYTPEAVGEADISNTPDTENLGTVAANTTYYAYGSAPSNPVQDGECTFTVTNNSGANVDITIEADNFTGGVGWALTSGAPGENTVKMIAYYSGQDPASGVTLTTSPQAFISALADNSSELWDFSLTTGTFTDGAEKTSLITLSAVLS